MEKDHGNSFWFYHLGLIAQYAIAVVGAMLLGLIAEGLLSTSGVYRHSTIQGFAPGIGLAALLLGLFVSRQFKRLHLAGGTWIIGSICFFQRDS